MTHMLRMAAEIDYVLSKESRSKRSLATSIGYSLMTDRVWNETVKLEKSQKDNVNTYWSYEDAPSNFVGLNFLRFYYNTYGFESETPLSTALEEYLKSLRVANPEDAPNWSEMPEYENPYVPAPQNKSFIPKYTISP